MGSNLVSCASNQGVDDDHHSIRPKTKKDSHADVRVSASEFEYKKGGAAVVSEKNEGQQQQQQLQPPKQSNNANDANKIGKSPKKKSSSKGVESADVRVSVSEFEFKKGEKSNIGENKNESIDGQSISKTETDLFEIDSTSQLMGFQFNEEGVLVDPNGKQFTFNYSENPSFNQQRFNELGEMVSLYIYDLLVSDCKLQRKEIPFDANDKEPKSFFFASKNALTTKDKLLILIHGSGQVRAGMWSRRVIMCQNLKAGSQLPFINRAMEEGYEIVVFNPNLNSYSHDKWPSDDQLIRGSESPVNHGLYVWKNFISKASAQKIAVVAHSYGGVVTLDLAAEKDFRNRVFAVALTDSVHSVDLVNTPKEVIAFLRERARNWVTSNLPLDTPIQTKKNLQVINDAPRVSAGDLRHECTSWSSFESIFKFFAEQYKKKQNSETMQSVL